MTTSSFWQNLLVLIHENSELRETFIQEMNRESDRGKKYNRLILLIRYSEYNTEDLRKFFQTMADGVLFLYAVELLSKKLGVWLTLKKDPGTYQLEKNDIISFLKLYDVKHMKQFEELYPDIRSSITSTILSILDFLERWYMRPDAFAVNRFSDLMALSTFAHIQDVILTLSIYFHITSSPRSERNVLYNITFLTQSFWIKVFENTQFRVFEANSSLRSYLFRGFATSIFLLVLFGPDHSTPGVRFFKHLDEFTNSYLIIRSIFDKILKKRWEREFRKTIEEFMKLIDSIGYAEVFSHKLGKLFKKYERKVHSQGADRFSLKKFFKKSLKDALSEGSAWERILKKQFPYRPLLFLNNWMSSRENLGLSYTLFGQDIVEYVTQYLQERVHQNDEILQVVLNQADKIFSKSHLETFVDKLMENTIVVMPSVNIDRYRNIFPEFLKKEAVRRAISRALIEDLSRKTVQQRFDPNMVEFLRDVLHAYVHRGKRRSRWKDTVGLRQSIEDYIKNSQPGVDLKSMLLEIKNMIR